jgi:hypothetical protein
MDALSAKGCITAFNAMGGVDVHIILPLPKYIHQGELVACEKTAIFVGNIPSRKGKRDGFASIFCAAYSGDKEELSESLSATTSADEMETECDGGSIDSK